MPEGVSVPFPSQSPAAASLRFRSGRPFDADARVLACAGGGDSRDQGSPLAPRRVSDKRHVGTMTIGPADTEARAQVSVRETTHRAGVGIANRYRARSLERKVSRAGEKPLPSRRSRRRRRRRRGIIQAPASALPSVERGLEAARPRAPNCPPFGGRWTVRPSDSPARVCMQAGNNRKALIPPACSRTHARTHPAQHRRRRRPPAATGYPGVPHSAPAFRASAKSIAGEDCAQSSVK
ncbi:hypothetical protein PCL_06230 [Purpureocillium lilacinum]|uniref:Uncharacterized protein n=1 Tax=Purpureocillium lilacinum TaxID=33203 RepID=A0A2U3EM75_PURLI|nr:hypothetical protein PCL_06230 [Purpureocillium lilacinum]